MPADRTSISYLDNATVLVAGSSDAAISRGLRTIEAFGMRVAGPVTIQEAKARIELQGSTSVVWIELDRDCGGPMDALLSQVSRDVAEGRYAAVVAASADLVDPVAAQVDDARVDIIVTADDAERAATLATALVPRSLRLSDVASDQSAARLRQLSDEVSRIAATLARLSTGPQAEPRRTEPVPSADVPEISP